MGAAPSLLALCCANGEATAAPSSRGLGGGGGTWPPREGQLSASGEERDGVSHGEESREAYHDAGAQPLPAIGCADGEAPSPAQHEREQDSPRASSGGRFMRPAIAQGSARVQRELGHLLQRLRPRETRGQTRCRGGRRPRAPPRAGFGSVGKNVEKPCGSLPGPGEKPHLPVWFFCAGVLHSQHTGRVWGFWALGEGLVSGPGACVA